MLLPLSKGEEGGAVEAKKLAGNPSPGLVNAGFETASPSAKTRIKAETSFFPSTSAIPHIGPKSATATGQESILDDPSKR